MARATGTTTTMDSSSGRDGQGWQFWRKTLAENSSGSGREAPTLYNATPQADAPLPMSVKPCPIQESPSLATPWSFFFLHSTTAQFFLLLSALQQLLLSPTPHPVQRELACCLLASFIHQPAWLELSARSSAHAPSPQNGG